jgi:hypothetical protein
MTNANINAIAVEVNREIRYWLADNPGILTRIAEQANAGQPYVSDILYGRRPALTEKGALIKAALSEAGAPGF